MLLGEGLLELGEGVGFGSHLECGDGEVAGDRVDGAGLELHEGVVVVGDGLELLEGVCDILLVTLQDLECGRALLGEDDLVLEVGQRGDTGVLLGNDNLCVDHVGLGEGVLVLAALDGEAVPDAVDGAGTQKGVLGVPVDGLGLELPALHLADSLGQVEVEAGVGAVVGNEAVGRVRGVEADDQGVKGNLAVSGLLLGLRATATGKAHGCDGGCSSACTQEAAAGKVLHGGVLSLVNI